MSFFDMAEIVLLKHVYKNVFMRILQ